MLVELLGDVLVGLGWLVVFVSFELKIGVFGWGLGGWIMWVCVIWGVVGDCGVG